LCKLVSMKQLFLVICSIALVSNAMAQYNAVPKQVIQKLGIDTVKEWTINIDSNGHRTDSSFQKYAYDTLGRPYFTGNSINGSKKQYDENILSDYHGIRLIARRYSDDSLVEMNYGYGLLYLMNNKKFLFFSDRDQSWKYFRRGLKMVELFVEKDRRKNIYRRVFGWHMPAYIDIQTNGTTTSMIRFEYHFR